MERRTILVVKYIKLGCGWITNEGGIKSNSHAFDSVAYVDGNTLIGALPYQRGKPVSEGEGRQRLAGHVSLEGLWKSPLNSMACRIGFQDTGLGWGRMGAAVG